MIKYRVREALIEDFDTLLAFEQGVVLAERPFNPTLKEGMIHYYDLEALMNAKDALVLVAEYGDEVVASGYAHLEAAKPYLRHDVHSYLGFMYVKPTHRGKGINRLIIEELISWTRKQGVAELRLDVYSENQPAIKAYKKLGFEDHMTQMRLSLG